MNSRNQLLPFGIFRFVATIILILTPLSGRAQTVEATIPIANQPKAIAINPVTQEVYIATCTAPGYFRPPAGEIAVIDGDTNTITQVSAGCSNAVGVAVNPVTNKIYLVDDVGDLTVIDGATNSTTTVNVPNTTMAVAVNPVSNKIYIGNSSGTVTVIDGATNAITTVTDPNASGLSAAAIAVNSVTNKIYVANNNANNLNGGTGPGNITVIDGATNNTTTVTDPNAVSPSSLAVNPVTNKIYVANSSNITVIDGTTNSITTVTDPNATAVGAPVGLYYQGYAVAVNSSTNKVYVANAASNNVTVIDGITNSTTTVADPNAVSPAWVAVNSTTNKIYVSNRGCGNGCNNGSVTIIDGATNSTTTVINPNFASQPAALALNSTTNKIYVASGGHVTVIDGGATATTHTLFLTISNSGTVTSSPTGIDCSTSCTASFATGTTVDLAAAPASGAEFLGWSTNCTGTSACNIMMTGDEFVTATFGPPPSFSLQPATLSLTAQRGGQVTDVLTIAPQNGSFTNAIQLSCAVIGSTPAATCALSPASVTPGANSVTSTLTITAPGLSAGLTPFSDGQPSVVGYAVLFPMQGLVLFGCCLAYGKTKPRRLRLWLLCCVFFAILGLQAGCGGGSSSPPPSALNYTVTVTAASGAIQQTAQVTVTVP